MHSSVVPFPVESGSSCGVGSTVSFPAAWIKPREQDKRLLNHL
jgi:hypothetical protein